MIHVLRHRVPKYKYRRDIQEDSDECRARGTTVRLALNGISAGASTQAHANQWNHTPEGAAQYH
jgi:hypothetical protein